MIYKLKHNKKEFITEDNRSLSDTLIYPKEITKFKFWLWLTNPHIIIYRYKNNKWDCVFNFPYRKLRKK